MEGKILDQFSTADLARFWKKVQKTESCWLWIASLDKNGYGQFRHDPRTLKAHMVSWVITNGPVPPGLELDHLCRIPACVNPSHLEPVTHKENIRRGYSTKPFRCGHPLIPDNTYINPKGQRRCRICKKAQERRSYVRRTLNATG